MVNARNAGDGIIFREDYSFAFDGSTSFSYRDSFLSNTNEFSLYLDINPIVSATRQVIFSFGDYNASSIFFEVGVSTNNKIFFYDGTTETEANAVLTSGVNYKVVVVYYSGGVVLYVNNLITNINFTNTLNSIDIVIGESVDGSGDLYTGYLNSVNLFVNSHDVEEVSVVSGITGLTFLPSTIPGLQVWLDPLNTSDLTMGAAPTLVDGDCDDYTQWTPFSSAVLSNPSATPRSGACMRVAYDGTASPYAYQSAVIITGNQYAYDIYMRNNLGVSANLYLGALSAASTSSASWERKTGDATSNNNFVRLYSLGGTAGQYGEFDAISLTNISITSIAPRAGALTSAFSNATATAQPWKDSTTGAIRQSGDVLNYAGAKANFNFLHQGAFTFIQVVNPNATSGTQYTFGTLLAGTQHGFAIGSNNAGAILRVANGDGGGTYFIVSSVASGFSAGSPAILTGMWAGGNNDGEIQINNNAIGTSAPVGTVSSSDATNLASLGGLPATPSLTGSMGDTIAFNRYLSAKERTLLKNYLASKWSITLP